MTKISLAISKGLSAKLITFNFSGTINGELHPEIRGLSWVSGAVTRASKPGRKIQVIGM